MTLMDPFNIDSGELVGLTPQQAFTLGVEWQLLRTEAAAKEAPFTAIIHRENVARCLAMLRCQQRAAKWRQIDGVWAELSIGAREAN